MYLSVGVVFLIVLMLLSPVIWIAWWLLGVLGRAKGSRQAGIRTPQIEFAGVRPETARGCASVLPNRRQITICWNGCRTAWWSSTPAG